jgi:signal transduction histidine kinase
MLVHRSLCNTSATPLVFSKLWSLGSPALADELSVRFSHQLERLRRATAAKQGGPPGRARANQRALSIMVALHTDTVAKLQEALRDRLRSTPSESDDGEMGRARWFSVDSGAALRSVLLDLEGRHSSAAEVTMELVQSNLLPADLCHPFLTMRISTLMLLQHHSQLSRVPTSDAGTPRVAAAPTLPTLAAAAATEARALAAVYYSGEIPDVLITDNTASGTALATVPGFVRYVLVELLKNALRAVMENSHSRDQSSSVSLSPIVITIGDDEEAQLVRLTIRDHGNGMTQGDASRALRRFSGAHSDHGEIASDNRLWDRLDDQVSYQPARGPMFGIGVGLALSRIHAEYLGGSLEVASWPGEGTLATLELPFGDSGVERIPWSLA